MSAWTADDLNAIEGNADLFVSPFRDDGATYGTPTQTWALVVDGDVYVWRFRLDVPIRPTSAKRRGAGTRRSRHA